jgi:Fe-S-cluster-containing dehydrogenase component
VARQLGRRGGRGARRRDLRLLATLREQSRGGAERIEAGQRSRSSLDKKRKRTDVAITRRELITNIGKAGVPVAVAMTVGGPGRFRQRKFPFPALLSGCSTTRVCASAAKPASPPVTRRTIRRPIPAATDCTRRPPTSTFSPATSSSSTNRKMVLHHLSSSASACNVSILVALPAAPSRLCTRIRTTGAVHWDGGKCIGCRYCTIACPIPCRAFSGWDSIPVITKCELCSHRLAKGLKPGCTSVCPVGAVIFGPRTALLLEAKRRIKNNPGRYYQDRVYGETDNGGTQALYLSRVPFEKLGLPEIGPESGPSKPCAGRNAFIPTSRCRPFCMPAW